MRGLLLLLLLSVATLASAPVSAGQRQHEMRLLKLQAWLEAVESHTPGRMDAAARTIGAWPNREIHLVTPYITALIDLLPESPGMLPRELRGSATRAARALASGPRLSRDDRSLILEELVPKVAAKMDRNDLVRRAALLHADVMILGLVDEHHYLKEEDARRQAQPSDRVMILGVDGQHRAYGVAPGHWRLARHLLETVSDDPAMAASSRLWYRATAAFLLFDSRWGEAEIHLEYVRDQGLADAALLFDAACVYEVYASRHTTTITDALRSPKGMSSVNIPPASENLRKAERLLEEAVLLDAGFFEARVRLARIKALLGRREEAARELRPLASGDAAPAVRYFAALFLGEVEQALGRRDVAIEAFRLAAALYPVAQSPRLALSALAIEHADRRGAVAELNELLQLPAEHSRRFDPWWVYHLGNGRNVEESLAGLWTTFTKARAR
jgi:tetratricopeptide (TPR) repeat protein